MAIPRPPTQRFFERVLEPGDCLLYEGAGLISKLIELKTWSDVSHIEIYAGNGKSFASRDGIGVNLYPLRLDVKYVLRPTEPLYFRRAVKWAMSVQGQKYDWLGLLKFFRIARGAQDRQFCSEFACRLYREAGIAPFHDSVDADAVSPGMFLTSTAFAHVWSRSPPRS